MDNLPQPNIRLRLPLIFTGYSLLAGGVLGILTAHSVFLSGCALVIGAVLILFNRHVIRSSQAFADNFNQLENQEENRLKDLKHYVTKTQYLENIGDLGEKAADQFSQISVRFKTCQSLLKQKFNPGELTYDRYSSAAEQAFLSVTEQLKVVASSLNSVSAVDPRHLDEQLKRLAADEKENAGEIKNLEERKSIRSQQLKTVTELLSLNEKAITEFDRLSVAISQAVTQRGQSPAELEAALEELKILAERAKKYSI